MLLESKLCGRITKMAQIDFPPNLHEYKKGGGEISSDLQDYAIIANLNKSSFQSYFLICSYLLIRNLKVNKILIKGRLLVFSDLCALNELLRDPKFFHVNDLSYQLIMFWTDDPMFISKKSHP